MCVSCSSFCWAPSPLRKELVLRTASHCSGSFRKIAADIFTCFLPSQFDLLEMDRLERPLVNLPLLLDPSSYVPDTVDLTDDAPARKYWLTCFEEALDGVRELRASEGLATSDCPRSLGTVRGTAGVLSRSRAVFICG